MREKNQKGREMKEKTIEEYRRDIYSLKSSLKKEEEYLEELRQKHSDLDVFGEESYTYSMKMKILEYNLDDVRIKMEKYSTDPAAMFYQINFATFAFIKACQIVSITHEMIFRAVDMQSKNVVSWFNFTNFLKQTLRLNTHFTNPIMKVLDPKDTTEITKQRYQKYLCSFMIDSEETSKKKSEDINDGVMNVCKELAKAGIAPAKIWRQKELNIATCAFGIYCKLDGIDPLDCIGVYCKCDPNKEGVIETSMVVNLLQHRIQDLKNFKQGDRFSISKKK